MKNLHYRLHRLEKGGMAVENLAKTDFLFRERERDIERERLRKRDREQERVKEKEREG